MEIVTDRTEYEILCILDRKNRAVDSAEIEKELKKTSIDISRRRIIQHLETLDEKGFSENLGRDGRRITDSGRWEVRKAFGATTDFAYDRVRSVITEANFDLERKKGDVIVNLSFIPENKEEEALTIVKDVCKKTSLISPLIKVAYPGEEIYNQEIPKGKIGLLTFCSVTLDEIMLKNGIYVDPHYLALIEVDKYKPIRCVGFYSYQEASTDPFELVISGARTSMHSAIMTGSGEVLADHRYIPRVAHETVVKIVKKYLNIFGGAVILGSRDYELGLRIKEGYMGVFATGGELILAALSVSKIISASKLVNAIVNYNELEPCCDISGELIEL